MWSFLAIRVYSGAGAAVPRAAASAVASATESKQMVVPRRSYHKLRGGIGEVMAVEPDWSALPSKTERLFNRLGKKENGGIGPDLFRRDMGGTGTNVKPLTYEPTLGTAFPRIGEIDSFNFEHVMEAKEAYVRDLRNASQPLGPVALEHEVHVLDEDPRCGSARFDFHFTDISKVDVDGEEFNNDNRRIFVREKSGVLRTASQEERDRSNQEFNSGKHAKAWLPVVFKDQSAYFRALEQFAHPYLLDEICRIRSATSAEYVRVHEWTYNHVAEMGIFQVLQDTPHFHGLARWLFSEDMVGRLLVPLLKDGRVADASDVIVAYCEERSTNAKVAEIEQGVVEALRERMPPVAAGAKSADGAEGVTMEIPVPRKWVGAFAAADSSPESMRRGALEANQSVDGAWIKVEWAETETTAPGSKGTSEEGGGVLMMEVSGSPGCVRSVSDAVFRATHDDVLAQVYLKVYAEVQDYADMKKLILDAMHKANIDDMLSTRL